MSEFIEFLSSESDSDSNWDEKEEIQENCINDSMDDEQNAHELSSQHPEAVLDSEYNTNNDNSENDNNDDHSNIQKSNRKNASTQKMEAKKRETLALIHQLHTQ